MKEFQGDLIENGRGIDRGCKKPWSLSRNEPRNAGNASNFTPGDSRLDSVSIVPADYEAITAASPARSAKELTFSTSPTNDSQFVSDQRSARNHGSPRAYYIARGIGSSSGTIEL